MTVSWKLSKSGVCLLALALGVAEIACSDSGGGGGTGGKAAGTGGKAGTGGVTAGTGGKGSGGSTVGTGGTTGDASTDAVVGTGGATGDGSTGTGGTTGDASTDAGTLLVNYTFDTTVQGFALNTFDDGSGQNIGAADASATPPTLTFDSATGNPNPGSLTVSGTFTKYNQTVDAIVNMGSSPLDLTGKTLHGMVRLDSGSLAFCVVHASTTSSFKFQNGTFNTPTMGTWKDFVCPLAAADTGDGGTGWNPAQVVQIGVSCGVGDPPADGGAKGSPLPTPDAFTFHIDTITD